MPQHRQPVRTGQTRRPGTDDRHGLARDLGAGEGVDALLLQVVGRVALQLTDQHRLALGHFAHTGLFAQLFGRADTGAHAAHDVLPQNRLGRRIRRARGDLADE